MVKWTHKLVSPGTYFFDKFETPGTKFSGLPAEILDNPLELKTMAWV